MYLTIMSICSHISPIPICNIEQSLSDLFLNHHRGTLFVADEIVVEAAAD